MYVSSGQTSPITPVPSLSLLLPGQVTWRHSQPEVPGLELAPIAGTFSRT